MASKKFGDYDVIGEILITKSKKYITKNKFPKFRAYLTCYSGVIAYVLFLEHLIFFKF